MDESPIPPRTPCESLQRSRYSLYQSEYETAAEDSDDGSLYYSLCDDGEKDIDSDDKENLQISTPRNGLSTRRTLLERCFQNNRNQTPRNEFIKRVSFNINPLSLSKSMNFPTKTFREASGSPTAQNEATKRLNHDEPSDWPISSSSVENITEIIHSLHRSTLSSGHDVSDLNEDGEDYSSSTIIEVTSTEINAIETIGEAQEGVNDEAIGETQVGAAAVVPTKTVHAILKTTNVANGPKKFVAAASNRHAATTFGLSHLPVPKKISVAELTNQPGTSVAARNLHGPHSKRVSLFPGRSTETCEYSKPNGKSGIPKASLILARNNAALNTSTKCQYCDKTFAKKSILDVHLLDKCDKIPPFRHRQLALQQFNSN